MKHKHTSQKWKRLRARRDDPETTKQYTPQDLKALAGDRSVGNGAGIIRPDNKLHLPTSMEDIGESEQTSHPNRVLLVIVVLSLIFISIIAYFVSQMPPKN